MHAAPTLALVAALVSGATLLATIDALAAAILVAVRPSPSCTSSCAGSRAGSPPCRAYPNWTEEDQENLTEREFHWRVHGMPEEARVYASILVRNNVVPEQVLFETGCTDYQDEHAYPSLAQAAENLMRVGSSTDDEDA